MARDFIEVYGTIVKIGPIEFGAQRLTLMNANTLNAAYVVDPQLEIIVQQSAYIVPISFELNTPITARGNYVQKSGEETMSYVQGTSGYGFIRYKGKVYK